MILNYDIVFDGKPKSKSAQLSSEIVKSFLDSGKDIAEVKIESGDYPSTTSAYGSLRHAASTEYANKVRIFTRARKTYIERIDGDR